MVQPLSIKIHLRGNVLDCRVREASPIEVFAVQVVGSVLALSLGRKLFPISTALDTAVSEQVLPSCAL